jgi:hypothetical protein
MLLGRLPNTKISCEGRHRGCPDLVCCILLLHGSYSSEGSHSSVTCGVFTFNWSWTWGADSA